MPPQEQTDFDSERLKTRLGELAFSTKYVLRKGNDTAAYQTKDKTMSPFFMAENIDEKGATITWWMGTTLSEIASKTIRLDYGVEKLLFDETEGPATTIWIIAKRGTAPETVELTVTFKPGI